MTTKIVMYFHSSSQAKRFLERVKALPFVTYANDYCVSWGRSAVMVCGEFTPEQEDQIRQLRSKK